MSLIVWRFFVTLFLTAVAAGDNVFQFKRFTTTKGVLHDSPHKIVQGKHRSHLYCAGLCSRVSDCSVFSYNSDMGECILSRRPDDDATDYNVVNPTWVTFNTVCPRDKGYVQYNSHQPPLCLRYVADLLQQQSAVNRCQQDGARLVRVKTMAVYRILKTILADAGRNDWSWVGADDIAVEGTIYWNDGTRLYQGTSIWMNPTDGYKASEDCICVSSSKTLNDCYCDDLYAFICQYDI